MISAVLQNYLTEKINPNPEIIDQALDSQKRLREVIENKLEEDSSLPYLLSGQDFLFGSAIRKTKPAPFDDIDLMLVLDGSNLIAIENGQNMGNAHGTGRRFNPLSNGEYTNENGHISSITVLNKIKNVLGETYSRSEIKKDGQAINVWMDSYGFGIDVVPAFKIDHITSGPHYFIPSGNNSSDWQSTNPHTDIIAYSNEDIVKNGRLTDTARLIRKWNEYHNFGRLSGFHLDALVYHSLSGEYVESLENAVTICLRKFDTLLESPCPQFSGFTPHIDHKLEKDKRNASRQAARESHSQISAANLNVMLGGRDARLQVWNSLFGGNLL